MTRASPASFALGLRRSSCRWLAMAASGLAAGCNALLDIDVAELACGPRACDAGAAASAGPLPQPEGAPATADGLDAGASPASPVAAAEAPAPLRPAAADEGAVDSVAHEVVSARVTYVAGAIR